MDEACARTRGVFAAAGRGRRWSGWSPSSSSRWRSSGPTASARTPSLTQIAVDGTLANYAHAIRPLYLGIIWKSLWFAAADHGAVPDRRLPGGHRHHLRLGEDQGLAAAADHAAVLDQPPDPHLCADGRAARRGLHQLRPWAWPGTALAHADRARSAIPWRRSSPLRAAAQQLRRGVRPGLRPAAVHGPAALRRARPARPLAARGQPRPRRRAISPPSPGSWFRWPCRASSRAS